jgi:hypothetical protein
MDLDLICSQFLGNQDWAPRLKDTLYTTAQYVAGHHPAGSGSSRKADFQSAARHAKGLRTALGKIDRRDLAEIMGPLRGEEIVAPPSLNEVRDPPAEPTGMGTIHQSFVPLRLAEVARFKATLKCLEPALIAKAEGVPVRRKRPPLPDPVLFGVGALQGLWRVAHGRLPTYSFNQNQFGDLALTVFGPGGLGIEPSAIRSAVRKVLTGSDDPETVSPEPD